MSKSICGLILTGVVIIFTLIGVLANYFFDKKKLDKKNYLLFITLFVSIILFIILFLFPGMYSCLGFKHLYLFLIFLVIGFIIMRVVDNYLPNHDNNKLTKKELPDNYIHIGILLSIVFIIYNIVVGMDIYNTVLTTVVEATSITISLIIRNILFAFIIYYLLNNKNILKYRKILLVLLLAISPIIGAVIMLVLNKTSSAIFVGCSFSLIIGMLSYILINELLLKVKKIKNKKELIIGIILGSVISLISLLV